MKEMLLAAVDAGIVDGLSFDPPHEHGMVTVTWQKALKYPTGS